MGAAPVPQRDGRLVSAVLEGAATAATPSTPTGPTLVVDRLSVSFDGGASTVVRDLSFAIGRGECVALVGESGSGKSVTARALLGVAGPKATVTAERLRWHDDELLELDERGWRRIRGRGISLVLQDALGSLDPLRRVGREVAEPLVIHDLASGAQLRSEVVDLLDRVGVPDPAIRAGQYPHELSGGLRQRGLIASALAAGPDIIIADEPTTALDVTVQARILELLSSLKASGTGILLISHDLAVVSSLADRVVVMRAGDVVETGTTAQVLTRPTSDYTRQLIGSIPGSGSRGRSLITGEALPRPTVDRSAAPVVEAVDLRKTYRLGHGRELVAVDGVSLSLAAGEVVGVVGESGSGKSTLGRLVLGLTDPDDGSVRVHGEDWSSVRGRARRALRRRIQTVSQDPLGSFDPRFTVAGLLAEALPPLSPAERRRRSIQLLESVGLGEPHLARKPVTLSGGQRQRVAIARALAAEPEVLVCDEAVSALDVTVQAQVLDLLEHLRVTTGVAMIFISHDIGVVQHIADRVLVMKDGRVVESGAVADVLGAPEHAYTRALLAAVPTIPGERPTSPGTIPPGAIPPGSVASDEGRT